MQLDCPLVCAGFLQGGTCDKLLTFIASHRGTEIGVKCWAWSTQSSISASGMFLVLLYLSAAAMCISSRLGSTTPWTSTPMTTMFSLFPVLEVCRW